jgi:hypothetical protein
LNAAASRSCFTGKFKLTLTRIPLFIQAQRR